MTRIKQYERVRIVQLHNAPEHYGSLEFDERLPAIGDMGFVIEILKTPGVADGYMVESSHAHTGENIWQCIFIADELEPVEDITRKNTMIVEAQVTINGSKAAVWAAITNIEHAAEIISGIEKIEVVEKPTTGLVGLRWRETRMLFGKPATVEKWITEAKENEFYTTRAEDGGFVFLTTMRISESGGSVTLASAHETRPQGFVAQLKSLPMVFFKGMIKKAILQDLNDIKTTVERG